MKTKLLRLILSMMSVAMLIGCSNHSWTKKSQFALSDPDRRAIKKADLTALLPPGPPAKAIAVWDPAVRHTGNETPQRGFASRVYFYDALAKRPIKVDGSIVVYAFDEDNRKPTDHVPTRSYYFAKEDVKKLHSKSQLGHSYNLWVPWDTEGSEGKVKKVSLIVRYVPDSGSSVISSQAIAYLPGKVDQNEMLAKAEWEKQQQLVGGAIQQVSYLTESGLRKNVANLPKPEERMIESNDNRPLRMQTSTISVPTGFSQGMEQALRTAPVESKTAMPSSGILPVGYMEEQLKEQSTSVEASGQESPLKAAPKLSERREAFHQKALHQKR